MKLVPLLAATFLAVALTGSLEIPLFGAVDPGAVPALAKADIPYEQQVDKVLRPLGQSFDDAKPHSKALTTGSLLNAKTIQPGGYIESGGHLCTMNYLYRGGGNYYIGTAAHCVNKVGDTARDTDGNPFGTVAAFGNANDARTDWALVKIKPAYYPLMSPAVRGHPDMPTGYTTSGNVDLGDLVQVSGYGMGFDFVGQTRENRYSMVFSVDSDEFMLAPSTATPGDSGGPFVHLESGKAFGIVSRGLPIGEDIGPTVEGMLPQMASKGHPVTLVTVAK